MTKLMVLSKIPAHMLEIKIPAEPEEIVHSSKVKILGVEIDHMINWKYFLLDGTMSVCKQLKTRLNSLKLLKRSSMETHMRMFASGIFMSKLEYGVEV